MGGNKNENRSEKNMKTRKRENGKTRHPTSEVYNESRINW